MEWLKVTASGSDRERMKDQLEIALQRIEAHEHLCEKVRQITTYYIYVFENSKGWIFESIMICRHLKESLDCRSLWDPTSHPTGQIW